MRISNRSIFKAKTHGEYKVDAKADESFIYLYDEISPWGITAENFVKDLNAITAPTIHLHVNSPGGSVFDGVAIFKAVNQHNSRIVAHVDGLAASIASVIVMAADEVTMGEGAFLMIHDPWSLVIGGAEDMRKEADLLDKVGGTIAKTYMDKTGKDETEIKSLMSAETWLTAQEALDSGFIDSIDVTDKEKKEEKKKKAQTATIFDLSAFMNVPDELKEPKKEKPSAKDLERILRDGGCSEKMAKSILSVGFKGDLCDATPLPDQRDVAETMPKKKDRIADLLIRAEIMAPSN